MQLNPSKTIVLIDFSITKFSDFTPISINVVEIVRVNEVKLLGVILRDDLKWNLHVAAITMNTENTYVSSNEVGRSSNA